MRVIKLKISKGKKQSAYLFSPHLISLKKYFKNIVRETKKAFFCLT